LFAEQVQHARRLKGLSSGFPAAVQRNGRCVIDIRLPKVYSICDPVWGWRGVVLYHHMLRSMQAKARQEEQAHEAAFIAAGGERSVDPEVQAVAEFADNAVERNEHNPFLHAATASATPAQYGTARAGAPRELSQAQAAMRRRQQPQVDLSDEAHAQQLHSPVPMCTVCCFMACPCCWWAPVPDADVCLACSLGGCQRTVNTCSFWRGGIA